jgi:uncharacterized protein YjiS (DUF1127 family)
MSSIAVDSPAQPGATEVRPRFAGLMQPVARLIAEFRNYRRGRRDVLALLDLDDRMLADIGLHRSALLHFRGRATRGRGTGRRGLARSWRISA